MTLKSSVKEPLSVCMKNTKDSPFSISPRDTDKYYYNLLLSDEECGGITVFPRDPFRANAAALFLTNVTQYEHVQRFIVYYRMEHRFTILHTLKGELLLKDNMYNIRWQIIPDHVFCITQQEGRVISLPTFDQVYTLLE